MAYYKRVVMDIVEALESEVEKGFDSADEKAEVFSELAEEYNVSVSEVYRIYYEFVGATTNFV